MKNTILIIIILCLVSCKVKNWQNNNDPLLISNDSVEVAQNIDLDYYSPQRMVYGDHIGLPTIKSIIFHRADWIYAPPVLDKNSEYGLHLSFDDLVSDVRDYRYSIIHCNADFSPSDLMPMEYLTGFNEGFITDFAYSRNTLIPYIHYELNFPEEQTQITKSGNYLLRVYYVDGSDEIEAFTRRFYFSEQIVGVSAEVKPSTEIELRNYQNEVDFVINANGFKIEDPYRNLNVVVLQNGRYDIANTRLKPKLITGDVLDYNHEYTNVFDGNNEFRWFDIKSLRYNSDRISLIERRDDMIHVQLTPDQRRPYQRYNTVADINGKLLIKNDDLSDSDLESEYVWVHFSLPYPNVLSEGKIFIQGALTDWEFSEEACMKYNYESMAYEDSLLLKQGYYNYQYTFVENNSSVGDAAFVEGRHSEAENDYTILVYYKEPGATYDRLLAVLHFNSRK